MVSVRDIAICGGLLGSLLFIGKAVKQPSGGSLGIRTATLGKTVNVEAVASVTRGTPPIDVKITVKVFDVTEETPVTEQTKSCTLNSLSDTCPLTFSFTGIEAHEYKIEGTATFHNDWGDYTAEDSTNVTVPGEKPEGTISVKAEVVSG